MRALVTGCAGFIGSHLSRSLLDDGHEVVGVDCLTDYYAPELKTANVGRLRNWDAFRFVHADLAQAQLEQLVADCAAIYHLAAEPGVRGSWGERFDVYSERNVVATQRLLEAAKDEPGRRVVYSSSSSVYGDAEAMPTSEDALPRPFSPYGVTKLAAEHLCVLYYGNCGLETVSLRYFSVYGPGQRPDMAFSRFCRAAVCREPLTVFGDGEQTRDFTFVADVVAATRAAALAPRAAGQVYNIGGGSRVSVNDALRLITDFAGRPLDVRYVERERGDVRDTGADTSRAAVDLGYCPTTPVDVGLEVEFEWVLAGARGVPGADVRAVEA